MAAISRLLRSASDGSLMYWCQGCDMLHHVKVGEGPGPRWGYNGNPEKPTFTPSVLTTYPWGPEQKEQRCHTFITDGMVQFLGDCTHAHAGKTEPLPELPEWLRDEAQQP